MSPDIVVDVGNSRIKWGRCASGKVKSMASLPLGDSTAWKKQLQDWRLPVNCNWAAASVNPRRLDEFTNWISQHGGTLCLIDSCHQMPLQTQLKKPDKAGIDRLLNAVAVNSRRRDNTPAAIIDIGSAVTVDFVNEKGEFCGGAIFPGPRLMAKSLRDYTALLPSVEITQTPAALGQDTVTAVQSGIFRAVVGGIAQLASEDLAGDGMQAFLTGGDAFLFAGELQRLVSVELWPEMTLEGIRLAAGFSY